MTREQLAEAKRLVAEWKSKRRNAGGVGSASE
jgi:hypothetical protein